MRALGLALVVLALALGGAREARGGGPQRRIQEDAEGRAMRVGFDLGSRWLIGVGIDPLDGLGHLEHGLRWRERDDEGVRWKLDHALLEANTDMRGAWSASLYRGLFLRNSGDGALIIPTSPPLRIVLPADLGFEVELGSVSRREVAVVKGEPGEGARERWEVGVARADLLFDFWRAELAGSYLALRTGMAYSLIGETAFSHVRHVATPFSRVGLDLMHTFDSGRQVIAAHAALSHRMVVARDATAWTTDADAAASWEVVVLAINDAPVTLRAELAFEHTAGDDTLRAIVGLRLGVPTD